MIKANFHIGEKFNRLTIVGKGEMEVQVCRTGTIERRRKCWAKCECGNLGYYTLHAIVGGNTKSCGCLKSENTSKRMSKHNKSGTLYYHLWRNMKARCYYPKHICFKHYGGRGITVCERWNVSFENFMSDMGERPTAKHTLERIDNDGNYEPSNCKWGTREEQVRNKRNGVTRVTFNGDSWVLVDLVKYLKLKIDAAMVRYRIKQGMSLDAALFTPLGSIGKIKDIAKP